MANLQRCFKCERLIRFKAIPGVFVEGSIRRQTAPFNIDGTLHKCIKQVNKKDQKYNIK